MDVTTTLNYLQVRVYILFLDNIAPISILYCILLIVCPTVPQTFRTQRFSLAIEYWLVAEAVSYCIIYLPFKYYLHRPATHPGPLSREEREELARRCWSTVTDPEKYLSQWFRGARKEDIKRENVREFLRWAFFNTEQITEQDEEELESYLKETERLLGRRIPPGRGNAKSIRLTLDGVDCSHRSLFWYFCITVVDTIAHCSMLYNGFHFHRTSVSRFFTLFPFRPLALLSTKRSPAKYITYWHREHLSDTRLPVLFIHGIGVGLYPYTNFLRDINKTGTLGGDDVDVGVIAIEIMAVSSRITHHAFDKHLLIDEIRAILKHHGWTKCIFVGHSYGTVICTHLLKSPHTTPLIGPVFLIDPICFLLHLPDVAYNFTARQPVHAKELVLWYFGSKDIGVAHTLARRFFWYENILWKEDLDVDGRQEVERRIVTVVLSGKDDIVNSQAVKQYLAASFLAGSTVHDETILKTNGTENELGTSIVHDEIKRMDVTSWTGSGLKVVWFERFHHGQVFDFKKARKSVIELIRAYSSQSRGEID